MLMELAFSLKSVYRFIDQTSDNEDNEIEESEKTPSPPSRPLVQPSKEKKKEKKKKVEISPVFSDTDFYKSTVHSRLTVFGILYAGRNFIKVKSHQPHQTDFKPYLQTLISENPLWASDMGLEHMKWKTILSVLKAMWRKYKSSKSLKNFDLSVGYSRAIYDSYLELEK